MVWGFGAGGVELMDPLAKETHSVWDEECEDLSFSLLNSCSWGPITMLRSLPTSWSFYGKCFTHRNYISKLFVLGVVCIAGAVLPRVPYTQFWSSVRSANETLTGFGRHEEHALLPPVAVADTRVCSEAGLQRGPLRVTSFQAARWLWHWQWFPAISCHFRWWVQQHPDIRSTADVA